jgi:glycosyltransferase involved in cell wall biosynthesis
MPFLTADTKIFLAVIVPCYNEAEVLHETGKRLGEKINRLISKSIISEKSQIVFIDDGSTDSTWAVINTFHGENPSLFGGIKLSKNSGHQNALLCGLLAMKDQADAVISMDADLQDDIDIIDDMLEKHLNGSEIVYGVRSDRKTDGFFKRVTAQVFYRFMRFLGVDIVYNHADFRLMGKRALDALAEYKEVNLFLRGLIPMLGYTTGFSYYSRAERFAGTSKYPLRKMLKFAFEGITSLSIKPIRFITLVGVLISGVSIGMIVYFLFRHFSGHTIAGWSSLIVSLWAIGGLTIFSIGIVGEYIGKIYLETKQRPRYRIETILTGERQS